MVQTEARRNGMRYDSMSEYKDLAQRDREIGQESLFGDVVSSAGAASRHAIGTGVIGGMLAATFLATLFVPLFFKWLERGKQVDPSHMDADDEEQHP